ncbi:FUSC family protein [Corynebacterium kalidii]|uniref:Aromatic acid exporter family protein n=1 Tax=Corynebacterium kalidii TaxID=2931982 RepID=A0A9X2AY12_9CORY|nr:aromatic acid exporter family protein [Corynebacterium kalidii]MCJ7857591.1 aromatic acid exporter family protein [Corynebacterium kalidii]
MARFSPSGGVRAPDTDTRGALGRLRDMARNPEASTAGLQIAKCVIAATGAWWVSVTFLNTSFPFLAPWVALLTIDATAYRTLSRGVQSTVASLLGIGVAFTVGTFLEVSLWTYALALLVGLVVAQVRWIRDEGVTVATMSIFILSDGFSEQQQQFGDRMLEIGVGVLVGVVVNLLVLPPMRDRQASRYVDSVNRRMGSVLENMGEEFASSWDTDRADAWIDETDSISRELGSAWSVVRFARESRRANPRSYLARLQRTRAATGRAPDPADATWEDILRRADEGVSHLRHLARTLREASYADGEWDTGFRREWASVARATGRAVADPDADVGPLSDRLAALTREFSDGDLPTDHWPVYGALITGLDHIITVVDDVASSQEARETAG